MRIALTWLLIICGQFHIFSQGSFSPQAGEQGSSAIPKDSVCFRDWAISCEVTRGYLRIDFPDSGLVSTGADLYGTGKANAPLTVSLGDGGSATLQFTASIFDGIGFDFAVFENGFGNGAEAFLELAFVEVSSDGEHFFRFPAFSEIQSDTQTGTFGHSDASKVHNLAGKYIAGFGVPFDLADLPDTALLDKQAVTHVKIIDVVGSINPSFASYDHLGNAINDPWPTAFESGGFDLDAVGVINSNLPIGISELTQASTTKGIYFDLLGRQIESPQNGQMVILNGNIQFYQAN